MTKNKKINWKLKIGMYIIGIPVSILLCLFFGFALVGIFWGVLNLIYGTIVWIGTGTFVELLEWTAILTRFSIILGIIIGVITFGMIVNDDF